MAKDLHGLRRTRFRGKRKVQIQLWLTAAAINIKRALREVGKKGPIANEAQAALPEPSLNCLGFFVAAAKEVAAGLHPIPALL